MVKLTSFIAFSALVILPTFAAVIPIIETSVLSFFFGVLFVISDKNFFFVWKIYIRDVAEPHFFNRDMEGLFTREQDFELVVRRGVEPEPEKGYVCFFFFSSSCIF